MADYTIRDATVVDMTAVQAIYAHHVATGLGTFEEIAPTVEDMTGRWRAVIGYGLPWLVAVDGAGQVLGYAYMGPFRTRSAYRYVVENSVYVAEAGQRRGVGKALMIEAMARCVPLGVRQVLAVIGDSGNKGSVGLHEALGFTHTGAFRDVGFKHGRWVDIVFMQKALGDGGESAPDTDGLPF